MLTRILNLTRTPGRLEGGRGSGWGAARVRVGLTGSLNCPAEAPRRAAVAVRRRGLAAAAPSAIRPIGYGQINPVRGPGRKIVHYLKRQPVNSRHAAGGVGSSGHQRSCWVSVSSEGGRLQTPLQHENVGWFSWTCVGCGCCYLNDCLSSRK